MYVGSFFSIKIQRSRKCKLMQLKKIALESNMESNIGVFDNIK
jgi:hypothetical protein